MSRLLPVSLALAAAMIATNTAAQQPKLVAAYLDQLAHRCGSAQAGFAAALREDLDGDGSLEWIIDVARYPCATADAETPKPITVFQQGADGVAAPVFQAFGFGGRMQRTAEGRAALFVTVGGADCGETEVRARCERRVQWRQETKRFDLQPLAPRRADAP